MLSRSEPNQFTDPEDSGKSEPSLSPGNDKQPPQENQPGLEESTLEDLQAPAADAPLIYNAPEFARDLFAAVDLVKDIEEDKSWVWLNLGGIPVRVAVYCMCSKPDPAEEPGTGGQGVTPSSPEDVMRITVYAPDDREYEIMAEEGYSERTKEILDLSDGNVQRLGLPDDLEHNRLSPFAGTVLEYTVTREELPGAVPIIASYLKGLAAASGDAEVQLSRQDVLNLVLGGLTGPGLANLTDDILSIPGEFSVADLFRRPEMAVINTIPVPLDEKDRNRLYSENPLLKLFSGATNPALAVLLKENESSPDYARAIEVVVSGLQQYYHSPMSSLYRDQFQKHRKRIEIAHQEELAKIYGPAGFRITDYVRFPEKLSRPTFDIDFSTPDMERLRACGTQMYYQYSAERSVQDPDTGEMRTIQWFRKGEPFLFGDYVNQLLQESFDRGYMVVPLEWKEEPATSELLHLWTMIGLSTFETPAMPPVGATLMVGREPGPFGRKMFFDFDDHTAGVGNEVPEFRELVQKLEEAYSRVPAEAIEILKGQSKSPYWVTMPSVGHLYFFENYAEPFELVIEYLKTRAAEVDYSGG